MSQHCLWSGCSGWPCSITLTFITIILSLLLFFWQGCTGVLRRSLCPFCISLSHLNNRILSFQTRWILQWEQAAKELSNLFSFSFLSNFFSCTCSALLVLFLSSICSVHFFLASHSCLWHTFSNISAPSINAFHSHFCTHLKTILKTVLKCRLFVNYTSLERPHKCRNVQLISW